jgi:repressor LexA
MALTRRQKEVLDFISQFVERNGYSPSYEEIASGLNLASLATVHKHLSALEAKQYIRRGFNQSRSLEVSPDYLQEQRQHRQDAAAGSVPWRGRIAAGTPVEAVANEESLSFADFVGRGETYALQVRGDSMIDDHICNGDFVLVERTDRVHDGEIVVALVDGTETTLKRLYREPDGQIRLQPANSSMQPIFVPAQSLSVQGRVLAVLRKYR